MRTAAVVGVAMFSNVAPDNFGVFDAAFLTLFYVTGGDPWPDALPKFNEDGSANWIVAAYIMAYTMIEIWVILQVPAGPAYACAEPATKRNMPVLCVEFDRFVLRRACVFRSDFVQTLGRLFQCRQSRQRPTKHCFTVFPSQVSVAVLLDNFITASAHMEQLEREKETARILRDNQSRNPLEPLLIKVATFRIYQSFYLCIFLSVDPYVYIHI